MQKKILFLFDGKAFYDPSILFVSIEPHEYLAVSHRRQDFFQFAIGSLECVKTEDSVIELFLYGKVFLGRREKTFSGWKYFLDEK